MRLTFTLSIFLLTFSSLNSFAQNKLEMEEIDKVVTTKEGAYFNYGNGTDRLGGAKINYIDEGIELHAVGVNENLYKIQLSDNRYTYIPKSVVTLNLPDVAIAAQQKKIVYEYNNKFLPALSESWSVTNRGEYDRVSISISEKRPYIIKHEVAPGKLIIDLFNVQNNSNWITQRGSFGAIERVNISGEDSDITRVTIDLKSKSHWGYSVKYVDNSLQIDIKHTPKLTLKGLTIGVDAGHGGTSTGAVGAKGSKEKDQTLAMALKLRDLLEKEGAKVVLSRESDINVDNLERVKLFKQENIDMLISIHCNAGGNPLTTSGTSTYYRHIEHRELANHILARILELEDVKNFGLIGNFNFTLNSPTDFPSTLVETLFISNLKDEERLVDSNFQKQIMKKVVNGIKDYLKYCKKLERGK